MRGGRGMGEGGGRKRAVVLTALGAEAEAVTAHLEDCREVAHPHGTRYQRGSWGSEEGWDVLVAEIGAGNQGAAAHAERAIAFFKPEVALFVGVAGGLKDVGVGDVVFGTKVYGFHSGKDDGELKPRPDVYRAAHDLEQAARSLRRSGGWSASGPEPQVVVGPIAAGEVVASAAQGQTVQWIRQQYGDAVAIEMEGAGFLAALHQNSGVRGAVVRGISDLVEGKNAREDEQTQPLAARAAAAFALALLTRSAEGAPSDASEAAPVFITDRQVSATFLGRDDWLEELDQWVGSEAPGPLVLVGMGGVGKSQLALQVARRQQGIRPVIWCLASDTDTLDLQLASVAEFLGLALDEPAREVRTWLDGHPDTLLVLDDAPDLESVERFVVDPVGPVLITSRNPSWHAVAQVRQVAPLDQEPAVALLLARSEDNPVDAESVATLVGRLPLALEAAADYAEATGSSYAEYAELLRARVNNSQEGAAAHDEVWELSMERVANDEPNAATLLYLLAVFSEAPLPLQLFAQMDPGADPVLAALSDQASRDRIIATLRRYSLVERRNRTLALHPVLRDFVRRHIPPDERRFLFHKAMTLLVNAFSDVDDSTGASAAADDLLPHVRFLTDQRPPEPAAAEVMAGLRARAVEYLYQRGSYATAAGDSVRTLELAEESGEPDAIDATLALRVRILTVLLDTTLGRDLAAKGVARAEEAQARGDADASGALARRLNDLARLCHLDGDLQAAEGHYRRALALAGDDAVGLAMISANLASLLEDMNRPHEAQVALERALDLVPPGREELSRAAMHSSLGLVLHRLGRMHEAELSLQKAVDIETALLEPTHPALLRSLNNLALVQLELHKTAEAVEALERCADAIRDAFGEGHPRHALALTNLGKGLTQAGLPHRALDVLETAHAYFESAGGAGADFAACCNNLGNLYAALGDGSRASKLYKQAVQLDRLFYGPDHPEVAIDLLNFAGFCWNHGIRTEARQYCDEAVRVAQESLGPENPLTARAKAFLANMLAAGPQRRQAVPMLKESIAVFEETFGVHHPTVIENLLHLSNMLSEQGNRKGAVRTIADALARMEARGVADVTQAKFIMDTLELARMVRDRKLVQRATNLGKQLFPDGITFLVPR